MASTMKQIGLAAMILNTAVASPMDAAGWEDLMSRSDAEFVPHSAIDYNATGIDSSDVDALNVALGYHKRQSVDCNNRPSDIAARAVCGPDFVDMANKGWGPAVAAMPQFDHARYDGNAFSCYPEFGGNVGTTGPNPGQPAGGPAGNPNANCRHPAGNRPYTGPLMRGDPFPVYVTGVYCGGDRTWRIIYSLYYPQDWTHRHDWEHAIVVWGKDVKRGGERDWWARINLHLSQHTGYNKLPWTSATAHDDPYSSSPNRGEIGSHPRVFPGMYKHAMFNEAKTSCVGPGCSTNEEEYRRNSWLYTPTAGDIRNGAQSPPRAWGDYSGKTPPWKAADGVCGMGLV